MCVFADMSMYVWDNIYCFICYYIGNHYTSLVIKQLYQFDNFYLPNIIFSKKL